MMYIVLVKDFRGKDVPNAERIYSLCTWYEETSMSVGLEKREYIPAWSLHRLIEIYDKTCIFWTDCGDNPYEAMISRIANKIKWGELNKEYLEERV